MSEHRTVWRKLAGESAGSALYSGWWTLHLRNTRKGIHNNHFWGATVRGFNAGTFMTSYGDRAWEATVERTWLSGRVGPTSGRLGYRAGFLYGYDEELLPIAGRVPVLPMMEVTVDAAYKHLGVQLAYAGIVVTAGGFYRF
jgi:hypothetical protein